MTATENATRARDEMEAWPRGDFDTVRSLVHDDVTFVGAMGTTNGVDAYVGGLSGLAQAVSGTDVKKVFADGDDVCVVYDLQTKAAGSLPCVAWYRFRAGKIVSKQVFFDPRPLLAGP